MFLDRDGVLNRAFLRGGVVAPARRAPRRWRYSRGLPRPAGSLRQAGYVLIVVTNQPDVARGTQRREVVEAINPPFVSAVGVDDLRVCYHDDVDACECRKPAPGMLLAAAEDWHVDLSSSFMVGDRWRDIEAGRRAGCRTVFVGDHHEQDRRAVAPTTCGLAGSCRGHHFEAENRRRW